MITLNFDEVLKRIYNAKKGVEVRYGLGQGFEYCKQFADEAQGYATNAKASEKKAADAVAGIEQTKTDAVQAVQNAQTGAVQAVDNERNAALQQVADSTQAAQTAASNAATSEQAAQTSKEAAETSATTASGSASAAATSESNAASSAQSAGADADRAEAAANLAGTRANTDKTLRIENAPADAAAVRKLIEESLAAQRAEDYAKIKFWVSPDPTSPAELFGGTWEQIKDRFILAAGDTYAAGSTGGSPTHTHDVSGNAAIGVVQNTTAYNSSGDKLSEEFPIGLFAHTHEYDSVFDNGNTFYSDIKCIKTKGNANEQSNMPPYLAAYIWKRIA